MKLENVDIVHNLTTFPYPFEDNSVDEIWMDNVLEHLENPLKVVEELYRISQLGAKLNISVPYYRSFHAFSDPTHVNFFSSFWFNQFDPTHLYWQKYRYSNVTFKIDKIIYDREWLEKKGYEFFTFYLTIIKN